mmetsp:Transcript_99105/g.175618  ORF Transcript_99105/g.175618 Transcript_99105/m.175618 type:complete len:121 (+) Transcript_99105:1922-2284(+)
MMPTGVAAPGMLNALVRSTQMLDRCSIAQRHAGHAERHHACHVRARAGQNVQRPMARASHMICRRCICSLRLSSGAFYRQGDTPSRGFEFMQIPARRGPLPEGGVLLAQQSEDLICLPHV